MKKTLKYLLKFAIGCAGIFWVVMMNRRALGIVNFGPLMDSRNVKSIVMEIWVGAASLYLIAQFGLYTMSLLKDPPVWVARFLDLGLVHYVKERYKLQMSARQRKVFSLTAWSAFIFALVMLLLTAGAFENSELFVLRVNKIRSELNEKVYGPFTGNFLTSQRLADEPVRYFLFRTEDNNIPKYLRDLYKIASDLKDADAKVVIAELPEGAESSGPSHYGGPEIMRLKARIDSLDIVVWSKQPRLLSASYYPRHESYRIDKSHPFTVFSAQKEYLYNALIPVFGPIVRWQPVMRADISRFPIYVPDAAIMAARKYFDIPDTCALVAEDANVKIGELTIPVSSSGMAFSDNMNPIYLMNPVTASRGRVDADDSVSPPDWLRYESQRNYGQTFADRQLDTVNDLSGFRSNFEGKAVVVNWMRNHLDEEFFEKLPETNVISSVLRRSFYTKLEWLTPALSLLSIALIALVSAFVGRARKIAYLSLLLMAGIMAVAVWLILSYRILFEPVYPVVACAISAVIFLLLKIARDAQMISRSSLVSGDRRAPVL